MAKVDWIYGIHTLTSVLSSEPERVLELFVLKGRDDERLHSLINIARKQRISVQFCARKTLDDFTKGEQHQGIVAKAKPARVLDESDLDQLVESTDMPLFLVLDGVTDPHNIGACLRTADAAGATALIVPKDKSGGLTPIARKVAVGAAESMPFIQVTNLSRTLKHLQQAGIWVVGTAGEAEQTIYAQDMKGPMDLVMGAEGKGMRRLTREHCDSLVKLPMAGSVSSLNVSVATGVCLFEIVRQRSDV